MLQISKISSIEQCHQVAASNSERAAKYSILYCLLAMQLRLLAWPGRFGRPWSLSVSIETTRIIIITKKLTTSYISIDLFVLSVRPSASLAHLSSRFFEHLN